MADADAPITCDRCRNSPAMTLLAYWPPACDRIARLLCGDCTPLDVKDLKDARWQHVLIPLAISEPGTRTEWAQVIHSPDHDPMVIAHPDEEKARTAVASYKRGGGAWATIQSRHVTPWKDSR